MNDSLRQALIEALDYLQALQREAVRPEEARARLQSLRRHHPDLAIELLHEIQHYDNTVHYDVLLRRAGDGTASLSYCPERAVPWPMRGVHRHDEGNLVRVNAHTLTVDQAIACLDFIWDDGRIIEGLVNTCLIHEELERDPIPFSDADLQEALNKFRAAKKLYKAADTLRWLKEHGMSQESLERHVRGDALVARLRDRVVADEVEPYFKQHGSEFDTVRVACVEVATECQAHELAEQVRAGKLDFYAAAERGFVEAAAGSAIPKGNLFTAMERRHAPPARRREPFRGHLARRRGDGPSHSWPAYFPPAPKKFASCSWQRYSGGAVTPTELPNSSCPSPDDQLFG
ncbi:MAG: TIGR04500 family putative peptide maturation system protein [Gemmataceae bacterium]|nr:TIGR04500 family putative peptide maturation system protein [Gemmataceae bacterium]